MLLKYKNAPVAELADAPGLDPGPSECRFNSCRAHQAKIIRTFSLLETGSDLSYSTLIPISTKSVSKNSSFCFVTLIIDFTYLCKYYCCIFLVKLINLKSDLVISYIEKACKTTYNQYIIGKMWFRNYTLVYSLLFSAKIISFFNFFIHYLLKSLFF